ncbi:unnamed protein product [Parnassius mnemosyne]|uniref:Reverse transcriptase domain-containing protein n=1 Tax=Parnassius mnemosyne TaxID=213953 RepID=A0AAV1KGE1_9NEOP
MEYVLAGLNGVHFLLDDILITGKDDAEHLDRLHQVLQKLQDAGLTLQKNKCSFFKDEISYLGYVINRNGTINATRPWELDILSPDTPGSSVSTPASCVPILPPDLQCHDQVRELGEGDGHEDRILTPVPAAETSNENLTNSNDSCRQSRSPSHITVTQGVRRPKSSDDEEEVSRAQEYQAPLKRNRPKVDYKKFF